MNTTLALACFQLRAKKETQRIIHIKHPVLHWTVFFSIRFFSSFSISRTHHNSNSNSNDSNRESGMRSMVSWSKWAQLIFMIMTKPYQYPLKISLSSSMPFYLFALHKYLCKGHVFFAKQKKQSISAANFIHI